jgi:hypothetical protein
MSNTLVYVIIAIGGEATEICFFTRFIRIYKLSQYFHVTTLHVCMYDGRNNVNPRRYRNLLQNPNDSHKNKS